MNLKPGDRLWIEWPRERGDRGLVVDTAHGRGGQVVYREREQSLVRMDGYVKRVRIDDDYTASIDLADGTRARCRGGECGPGHYQGEVVDVSPGG